MKTTELLTEDLNPEVISQLDDLVRFTILPALSQDLHLTTKRERKQALFYLYYKLKEISA